MIARHRSTPNTIYRNSAEGFTPSKVLVADIESDGLIPTMTVVHSLCIANSRGDVLSCADQPGYVPISVGLQILSEADVMVFHNGSSFDVPALKKIYPNWNPKSRLLDTLLLSRIAYNDIRINGPNNSQLPSRLKGRHSVEAWGDRLHLPKDDYKNKRLAELEAEGVPEEDRDIWQTWCPTMQEYCEQDALVGLRIFKFLWKRGVKSNVISLEHDFAELIRGQETRGAGFDMPAALDLNNKIAYRNTQLEKELIEEFGSWWRVKKVGRNEADGAVTTKRTARQWVQDPNGACKNTIKIDTGETYEHTFKNGRKATRKKWREEIQTGYWRCVTEGTRWTPVYYHTFNAGSRQDCILVLKEKYNWKPSKLTEKGAAKLDEQVLEGLREEIPSAEKLIDFFMTTKRLGQVGHGKQAWIKKAVKHEDGVYRIHGKVNTLGAATHRCSHSDPNLAQVPAGGEKVPYGKECRSLFIPTPGYDLMGSDAKALELRILAHYLAAFDGGEFAKVVDEGDPHSWFRDLIGTDLLGEGAPGRAKAKTVRYALLYGAGAAKLGRTARPGCKPKESIEIGSAIKARIAQNIEAEALLTDRVKEHAQQKGYIVGLDGRYLTIRKAHAALNTLLQSGGAIAMKQVLVTHNQQMRQHKLPSGRLWRYVLNIHDEFQSEVLPEIREQYRKITIDSYGIAGDTLKMRCILRGSVDPETGGGRNWYDTH